MLNALYFCAQVPSLMNGASSHSLAEQQQEELTCFCYHQVKTVGNFRTTP